MSPKSIIDHCYAILKNDHLDKNEKFDAFYNCLATCTRDEMVGAMDHFDSAYLYLKTGNGFYALKWYAKHSKPLPPENAIYSIHDFVLASVIVSLPTIVTDILAPHIDIDDAFNTSEEAIKPILTYAKIQPEYIDIIHKIGSRIAFHDWTTTTLLKEHPLLIQHLISEAMQQEQTYKIDLLVTPWIESMLKHGTPVELASFYTRADMGLDTYLHYQSSFHESMEKHPTYKDALSMSMLTNTNPWVLVKTMYESVELPPQSLEFANLHLD